MSTLLSFLCLHLRCAPQRLGDRLKHPETLDAMNTIVKEMRIGTNYGKRRLIRFSEFSDDSAEALFAYEGFQKTTVNQHFFSRHRIILKHRYLPCVVEKHPNNHKQYFPLELLEIV